MTGARHTGRLDIALLVFGATVFAIKVTTAILSYGTWLKHFFFDWTFYAGAVDRWLSGAQIYPGGTISTLGAEAGSGYAYPPASVPLFLPFSNWPLGAILWEVLLVSIFVFGTFQVVRVGWPQHPLGALGLALLVAAFVEGIVFGFAVANVNMATAGMVGIVWSRTQNMAVPIGTLGVIKIFPIALAAPHGFRVLMTALAVGIAICLLTLPMVGVGAWSDYVTGLLQSQPACGDPRYTNPSLACALSPLIGMNAAKWAGLVVAGVLVAIALRSRNRSVAVAAAGLAILAPATELHAHYVAIIFVIGVIGLASLQVHRATGATVDVVDISRHTLVRRRSG